MKTTDEKRKYIIKKIYKNNPHNDTVLGLIKEISSKSHFKDKTINELYKSIKWMNDNR
jgi:hypothetical protein